MVSLKPITIVGGGLSGLTLGTGLRRCGVPVTVWEAGHYPRHRVCGEFICGHGLATLERLGLGELFDQAGAFSARTTVFFSKYFGTRTRQLPSTALCLSRYVMDDLLAREVGRLDGALREGARCREDDFGESVVRATGRRSRPLENGWRWFGLKAHARKVELVADLEMHVSAMGYVGFCRLNSGEVNVCGLFRRRVGAVGTAQSGPELLRGQAGTLLNERLADAQFDERSFCAVAGLSLRPQAASARIECCIGDAITMIPPVTGNGMSMAFESAEMAVDPLVAWSRGEIQWAEARQRIARRCDAAFGRRLAWARWVQAMIFAPGLQSALICLTSRSDWFWRATFERTR